MTEFNSRGDSLIELENQLHHSADIHIQMQDKLNQYEEYTLKIKRVRRVQICASALLLIWVFPCIILLYAQVLTFFHHRTFQVLKIIYRIFCKKTPTRRHKQAPTYCIHTHTCVCMYIHVYVRVHVRTRTCACIYTCMYIYTQDS